MDSVDTYDQRKSKTIGYSARWLLYNTFEYYEDACYIADTPELLRSFKELGSSGSDYETVAVSVSDVLEDYAFSNRWYAFERGAFEKFVKVIDALGIDCRMIPEKSFDGSQDGILKFRIEAPLNESDDDFLLDILEDLSIFDGVYKRESVDAAIENKDEIIPLLIDTLEEVLSSPEEYANNPDYFLPTYAVMLLGHFREAKAHTPIIRLLELPEDTTDDLLGELVHEDIPTILFRTSGGSFEEIKSVVLNRSAWIYSRIAALESMVLAVLEGVLDRDETLEFISSLYWDKKDGFPYEFWTSFVRCVYDLYPLELLDTVKNIYSEELIDLFSIHLKDLETALEQDKKAFLEERRTYKQRHSLDDIHKAMSWWACFNREKDASQISRSPVDSFHKPEIRVKSQKEKKSRKKMKKASRKKNRR